MLTNGSIPTALTHHDRRWTLELYELAAVGHCVYRPKRRRLEGRLAILTYLRRHDPKGTLSGITDRLMRRQAAVDCAFEAVNGGWLRRSCRAATPAAAEPPLSESATVR